MKLFGLLLLGLSCCAAQVQNTTRPESGEYENFSFVYEHATQTMLVHSERGICYIWALTSDELASVHTDDGLKQIEIRVLKEIDDAFFTVVPENVINVNIARVCHIPGRNINMHYYLVH